MQNWNIQLGSKIESIPYLKEAEVIVLSYTTDKETEKKQTDIRQIDSQTGITNWINSFELSARFSLIRDDNEKKITLISDALNILQIDTESGKILWKLNLSGELRTYTSTEDSIYILTTENKVFRISIKDGSLISNDNLNLKNISAISYNGSSLLVGNMNGILYKFSDRSSPEKRLLRTGGEISFIKNYGGDLLVVSNDNFLYYYSTEKEKAIWKKRLSGRVILEPVIYNELIFTTTSAEPVIYIFRRVDGLLINQINLGENQIIRDIEVNDNSINVLTNVGLTKFGVNCQN